LTFGFLAYAFVFRDPGLSLFHCSSAPTSCLPVGSRNRNAIEDDLEALYDAYYEELEQYANYQQRYVSSGGTLPPPPGPGPFPGSVELDKNGVVVGRQELQPLSSHPNLGPKNPLIAAVPNGRGPKAQVKHLDSDGEVVDAKPEREKLFSFGSSLTVIGKSIFLCTPVELSQF